MPTIRISKEKYELLEKASREKPGVVERAARIAGVGPRTAKKGWEDGWDRPEWAVSIRKKLEREREELRAELNRTELEEQAVRDRDELMKAENGARLRADSAAARKDELNQSMREARAIRAAMQNAEGLLGVASTLGAAMVGIVQKAALALRAPDAPAMSVSEVVELMKTIAWIGQTATSLVGRSMALERLRLGRGDVPIDGGGVDATPTFDFARAEELLGGPDAVNSAIADLARGNINERTARLLETTIVPAAPGKQ